MLDPTSTALSDTKRTRYAIVGCGNRALGMFAKPLVQDYPKVAELVALCDTNTHRMRYYQKQLATEPAMYTDFTRLLAEIKPDRVIVCSPDHLHDEFVVEALAAGCQQVICEKPITTDPEKLHRIIEAEQRYPGKIIVTFNYRHAPLVTKVKQLIVEGALGQVTNTNLEWHLDAHHGADYFRRWHARKLWSGGLQVHKSTHHFDIANWWLDAEPQSVTASSALRRYGKAGPFRSERCTGCEYAQHCPFYYDLANDAYCKELYLDGEHEDGYFRDRCVFDENIDIEDTFQVLINYPQAIVNYSLVAYAPWEGWRASITGTEGRLEVRCTHTWSGDDQPEDTIHLSRIDGKQEGYIPWRGPDYNPHGHGGGDVRLREYLFGDRTDDPLHIMADSRAGAYSAGVGFAVNQSLAKGTSVRLTEVIPMDYT